MSNGRLASIAVLLLLWNSSFQTSPNVVRVLTYNIHHGEGTDGVFDLDRLANIIKSAEPDLVALQEVDQGTERAAGVNQLTELGRLTGLQATFGKAMDFQGGGYGVGVLSRQPPLSVQNHPLPGPPGREPRTALAVDVAMRERGPVLQFISTHLDFGRDSENRAAQAESLNRLIVRDGRPSILAGDMNSRIDSPVMQILGLRWTIASSVDLSPIDPAARPQGGVDYVLFQPSDVWRMIEWNVVDAPVASDHQPVLAVLEWIGKT